jgi:hypothetical protein
MIGEPERKGWDEAEQALASAQLMPVGPKRIAALKKAGRLRFSADEQRRKIRDQEPATKNQIDRQIKAEDFLRSRS